MNNMTFEKLQYHELKQIVQSYCVSGLGKRLIDKQEPSTNIQVVNNRLQETTEARAIIDAEGHIPFVGITNIESIIDSLEKGIILQPSDLVSLSDFLRGCRKIKQFMQSKEFFAPTLASYAQSMSEMKTIEEEINFTIKGSRIDSSASRELKRIRFKKEATEEKISERLNKFLNNSTNKKYIQEFFISKKDDRYTIPIKASYKGQVPGAVIEVSSTGATVFIEPQTISKLSAELASLKADEEMEEYQILATLSGIIVAELQKLKVNMELISQYDMVFAKAKYSKQIAGIQPIVNDHGYIKIVNGKHPLLPKDAVPLQFEIGKEYRSLIITGPNAGGKTIVLKTIGLLTIATMLGLHIAAEQGTEIAIFEHIFVDIGDNQSIENALSTFSSHMKNLSEIMSASNHRTLLLFDEIGSGTEPNEGAALAIAILEEFYHMGCLTIATTHYGEIKRYSELHSDFMNAAMQFDQETLSPLYQLVIGESGDSNALWISRKMNIKESVLKRAEAYMENKDYQLKQVNPDKIRQPKLRSEAITAKYDYKKGDRVKLLDHNDFAIIYKEMDQFYNVVVYYKGEMIEVNVKRITLNLPAHELYPEGYDLETLFTDFATRKMEHDINRGSKKALRKIQKEMRKK
ncbi:endonuclease MutS2 [Cytobacillus sp. Sa5YUA1]|uniref:Endonuclease MutS2 n=1 Tax=Cytobacillus stercorigallinarum TaxID=2762240 RepID=A0ABR8QU14_9BACI|nr:endonuclease MutS2 [Cytobacillus stercorigallinarum]MBD7939031.1 endonuclease MutS2 [Cytobacillus stercorigallinarum]